MIQSLIEVRSTTLYICCQRYIIFHSVWTVANIIFYDKENVERWNEPFAIGGNVCETERTLPGLFDLVAPFKFFFKKSNSAGCFLYS